MNIIGSNVVFGSGDAEFVKKFGLFEAAQMVLDYKSRNNLPFIYDTYQLADFLGIKRKELFFISKNTDKYYNAFEIKKKNGKPRRLYAPVSPFQNMPPLIKKALKYPKMPLPI